MGISGSISSRDNQIKLFGFVELLFDLRKIKIMPGVKMEVIMLGSIIEKSKQDVYILTG